MGHTVSLGPFCKYVPLMTELDDGTVVLSINADYKKGSVIKRCDLLNTELLDSTEVFQVEGMARVNLAGSTVLAISNK